MGEAERQEKVIGIFPLRLTMHRGKRQVSAGRSHGLCARSRGVLWQLGVCTGQCLPPQGGRGEVRSQKQVCVPKFRFPLGVLFINFIFC